MNATSTDSGSESARTRTARGRGALAFVWRAMVLVSELSAAALAFATLLAFGARHAWICELIVHWRGVLGGLLVCAALLSFVARHHRRAGVALLFALINGACLVPLFLGEHASGGVTALRVFHANVDIASQDVAGVARALAAADADVVVLQEVGTRWLADLAPTLAAYPYRIEEPRESAFGLAVYSRFELFDGGMVLLSERPTPAIAARVAAPGGAITLFATHPRPPLNPWSRGVRDLQLAGLARHVRESSGPVVVVGDLNTSPLAPSFRRLLAEGGLIDGARGFGWQATWPAPLPAPLRIRIDHLLHTADLGVVRYEVGESLGSDHLPIVVDLTLARTAP